MACPVDTAGPSLCSELKTTYCYAGCVGICRDIFEGGAAMVFSWKKVIIQQSCTFHITDISSLGSFAKLRKRLLASSCLSVRMEQLGSHWTDFHEIL